jgi:hypothetical protein
MTLCVNWISRSIALNINTFNKLTLYPYHLLCLIDNFTRNDGLFNIHFIIIH